MSKGEAPPHDPPGGGPGVNGTPSAVALSLRKAAPATEPVPKDDERGEFRPARPGGPPDAALRTQQAPRPSPHPQGWPRPAPARPDLPLRPPVGPRPTAPARDLDAQQAEHPTPSTTRIAARLTLLAAIMVLGAAGIGAIVGQLLPVQYLARAELLYPISVEQPTGFLREDRNLTTQVLLLRSRAVLEPVARGEGIEVAELHDRLTAEVLESSEIIAVQLLWPDRDEGVRIATEVTSRYLDLATGERTDPARTYVESELDETRRRLVDVPDDENLLERERALVAQLDSLTTAQLSRPEPTVLVEPYADPDPVGGPVLTAAVGGLLGALVAAPVVLVLARRQNLRR